MSQQDAFYSLNIAVLTVSDTRDEQTDSSGAYLTTALQQAGHQLAEKAIVRDCRYQIRATVSAWVADSAIHSILLTGGTGFSPRDVTPEAVSVLFDKPIEGFGELFRAISYDEIGTATLQSRAVAGMANNTAIFCLPGSTGACKTGWENILKQQLDRSHKPCNFVGHVLRGAQ